MCLELWIDTKNKIISFREVPEWLYKQFDSEQSIRKQLERFIQNGFRFQ